MSTGLDVKVEKAEWHGNRKLKLTARDFVYYFNFRFNQETNSLYPIKLINWYDLGNRLKKFIFDEFSLREFGVKEMKELIDWIFETRKPKHWDLDKIQWFAEDWLKQKSIKTRLIKIRSDENVRARRMEAKQYIKMLGEGYYDNQLTKNQYWSGLEWRRVNLSVEKLKKLEEWQKKEFAPAELSQLTSWKNELKEKGKDINLQRLFYIEFARSKGQTLLEILHEMRLERLYELYTKKELERRWHE